MTSRRKIVIKSGLFEKETIIRSLIMSVYKLNPKIIIKNPVMFTVEICTIIMLIITFITAINSQTLQGSFLYNLLITLILVLTLLFSNFAESLAEARGKAQADSLRSTREKTFGNVIDSDGNINSVLSAEIKKGDFFLVRQGEVIPTDGEIMFGIATIDESAITGESAPVVREAGGDRSGVTGGTKLLVGEIKVLATSEQGETFLDKMIKLVEGANRQKTPNEIALSLLLASFTLIFLIVTITLHYFGTLSHTVIQISSLISLFVCLIPTTIGSLLSAIGIAGIDRALRANVLSKSGKAVETAGDVDTLLLDKTGTITIGNRKATDFILLNDKFEKNEFIKFCALSSIADDTPEGKSIIELAHSHNIFVNPVDYKVQRFIKFSPQTRYSGVELSDGTSVRKGSIDAILNLSLQTDNGNRNVIESEAKKISEEGGTPLIIAINEIPVGLIKLQDIIKTGIFERFQRLKRMGVKTVMVTGDNRYTAKYIAEKAGVDDFIAEAKPEDKLSYIIKEQSEGKLVAMMGDGTNDAPALAQADIGVAMNSGTQAAKEAGNMVDLDNDPTKLIEIVEIGKQLLMTRGTLTTFSIANDIAKYFAILPALFISTIPGIGVLNIMKLSDPNSAILSAIIFNALIIPLLIPLALRGVKYKPLGASALLARNVIFYGLGGIIIPFIGIKLIDLFISLIT